MSQWTHVAAVFRLDSFGFITKEEITNIIDKQVDYEDMQYLQYEDGKVVNKEELLPVGSEGILQTSIWYNPRKNCLASTIVTVFGDLRDYSDMEELKIWFNKSCEKFCREFSYIRQAVMQVEVEGDKPEIFSWQGDN